MVQVRTAQPISQDGSIDLPSWVAQIVAIDPLLDTEGLLKACDFARDAELKAKAADNIWAEGMSSLQTGLEIAQILVDLKLDQETLVAAILYRTVREGKAPKTYAVCWWPWLMMCASR